MNKKNIFLAAILVPAILIGLILALGRKRVNNSSATPMGATDQTVETQNEATNQDIETFVVTASNYSFSPKEIKVKKGNTVKIILKNADGFHDFVLDEFNVRTKQISANQEDSIIFTADKTGTFEYYCSVGKHRQMGMVGKLIVE